MNGLLSHCKNVMYIFSPLTFNSLKNIQFSRFYQSLAMGHHWHPGPTLDTPVLVFPFALSTSYIRSMYITLFYFSPCTILCRFFLSLSATLLPLPTTPLMCEHFIVSLLSNTPTLICALIPQHIPEQLINL